MLVNILFSNTLLNKLDFKLPLHSKIVTNIFFSILEIYISHKNLFKNLMCIILYNEIISGSNCINDQ